MNLNTDINQIQAALDESAIVAVTDRAGTIIYANDKFCKISGYSKNELIGSNHRILNSEHHSFEFFKSLWSTISAGRTWVGEICNRSKSGEFYWVYTTIVPFLDENRKPYQYIAIRFDITERKKAELQLKEYSEQLVLQNKKIQESQQKIIQQDRLASVGLLASSLAHEIGTPLGVIRGRAELIQEGHDPKKNGKIIVSQIDRVSQLIQALLNLARGDKKYYTESIGLNQAIQDVLDLLAYEFRKANIEIKLELEENTHLKVKAESGPLQQVFLNLIVNALHAIQSKNKRVLANNFQQKQWISIRSMRVQNQSEKRVFIEIWDSGEGVSPKIVNYLFQPFFTTKSVGEGTGLGLATSFQILESWGGSLVYVPEKSPGACFRVILPLSD